MTRTTARRTLAMKLALAIASPALFLLVSEAVVRVSGIETEVARNENFDIAVPVWLLADENWADIMRGRLAQPRGVRAIDVGWLRHFEEARYIEYKLKPNVRVSAVNPFNDIEVRKGIAFRFESNSDGFRTQELEPKAPGTARIVTLGDSSTFGWGVNAAYTYQSLLEDRLNRRPGRVDVLNLGISGHTSRHGRAVFDHYARALDPDLLVISFGANDGRYVLESADVALGRDEGWRGGVFQRVDAVRDVPADAPSAPGDAGSHPRVTRQGRSRGRRARAGQRRSDRCLQGQSALSHRGGAVDRGRSGAVVRLLSSTMVLGDGRGCR
ncbi:MAG: GDSL-type esterase/lipase family protein [Acidobacteria bacterium]|nr:GDSL-type esterase/lipase family protein [Acidobacteriota bacterium]